MGIDYSPIVAIGKRFRDREEAATFVIENAVQPLGDLDKELIEEGGFQEWIESQDSFPCLYGSCIDHYSGRGYWIGFELGSINDLKDIDNCIQLFKDVFDVEPEFIKEVMVY